MGGYQITYTNIQYPYQSGSRTVHLKARAFARDPSVRFDLSQVARRLGLAPELVDEESAGEYQMQSCVTCLLLSQGFSVGLSAASVFNLT